MKVSGIHREDRETNGRVGVREARGDVNKAPAMQFGASGRLSTRAAEAEPGVSHKQARIKGNILYYFMMGTVMSSMEDREKSCCSAALFRHQAEASDPQPDPATPRRPSLAT
jgi:hypothetical protein